MAVAILASCNSEWMIEREKWIQREAYDSSIQSDEGLNTLAFQIDTLEYERMLDRTSDLIAGVYYAPWVIATYNETKDSIQVRSVLSSLNNTTLPCVVVMMYLALPVSKLNSEDQIKVDADDVRVGYFRSPRYHYLLDASIDACSVRIRRYDEMANVLSADFEINGTMTKNGDGALIPVPFQTQNGQFDIIINSWYITAYKNMWRPMFWEDLQKIVFPESYSDRKELVPPSN